MLLIRPRNTVIACLLLVSCLLTSCSEESPSQPGEISHQPDAARGTTAGLNKRPNILLIVADDMGFSDIGAFGGEIRTPNLDALASRGTVLTGLHTAIACNPTRAALLSGIDNNRSGIGSRSNYHLDTNTVTLAARLRESGYRTFVTGKWDLGRTAETLPPARGFERSFVLANGSASHFNEPSLPSREPAYFADGEPVTLPEDFYSTFFYTEKMIEYLVEDDDAPFFAYLSYTAPHWPLQVPDEYLDLYAGQYDKGYLATRDARIRRMKEKGILPESFLPSPGYDWPDWDTLDPEIRATEIRRMEVYATMVELMDRGIGRVLEYLRRSDKLDNTLILFMSDNGADGGIDVPVVVDHAEQGPDNSLDNIGRSGSYVVAGHHWGQVQSAPFRLYKYHSTEGGISVPAIAVWPGRVPRGRTSREFLSVVDVLPTLLDIAGGTRPGQTDRQHSSLNIDGRSALPHLLGMESGPYDRDFEFGWSYSRIDPLINLAIRKGPWKLVWEGDQRDEVPAPLLFNLETDPGEIHDLYTTHPEQVEMLRGAWQRYAARNNIKISLP